MPNLLAMSFEGELAPSFDLRCLEPHRTLPDGWGIGYYPGGEPSATVLKEPAPHSGSIRSQLVEAWEHLESSLFVVHIRHATWGAITDANTQPFTRAWGRRDWLFAHAGSLLSRPELEPHATFEPVGSTDTELIFCELMNRVAECGWWSGACTCSGSRPCTIASRACSRTRWSCRWTASGATTTTSSGTGCGGS